jgi:hypothetical protein
MNLKLSAAGFAIQADKGAPEAQPAYWGPVGGGGLVGFELEQTEDELTSAEIGGIGEYRAGVAVGADYESRMWPASIAGLLYAVLGDISTTGVSAPYTHTIVPASLLPWATVFGQKDMERKAASDCKCDELKIEWEGNSPVKVTPTWAGMGAMWSDVAYVPALDEALLSYFKGIHLAATIDLDGATHDGGATILSGSLDIKRNLTGDTKSGQLEPSDVNEGALEIDVELKVRVPDLTLVRLLLTGAVDGDTITADVPYGDFSLAFTDAPDSVTLAATRVAFKTSEPDADPKGGPGELTLTGRCYGNPCLTAIAVNDVATY